MYIEGEPVLAFCYINKQGDEDNMCYLSKEKLFVRYKKKLYVFLNENVQGISFDSKMFLFPLVIGGIITPLSIHAILNTFVNPWLLLILMIIGLFLMYYGWEGSVAMTIKTRVQEHYFFIKSTTPNLEAFSEYVEFFISDDEKGRKFYFVMNINDWAEFKGQGNVKTDQPLLLLNWKDARQIALGQDRVLLAVDPTENDIPISFVTTSNKKKLQPVISDNIPVHLIMEVTDHN